MKKSYILNDNSLNTSLNSNSFIKTEINGIFVDQNASNVLCIAKNKGYSILSIPSFEIITDNNELGELKIILPFYLSEIILLVGKNKFSQIKSNQLIIYNDKKKSNLGKISFELEIINIKIVFNLVIINFYNQIIIYDLLTLNSIKTINNTIMDLFSSIINIKQNKYFIISLLNSNKKQILINQLSFEENKNKNKKLNINKEEIINANCNFISNLSCDSIAMNILLQVNEENKFNIYNIITKQLIYSFTIDENLLKINKILFRDNFAIFLFSNFLIQVYKINILNKNDKLDYFHKYKYDYKYYDEIIDNNYEQKNKNGYIIKYCNEKLKNDFIIYDYHGIYQKIKFNIKENNNIYCYLEKKFIID